VAEIEFTVVRTPQGWAVRRDGAVFACADEESAIAEATARAMKAHEAGQEAAAIDGEGRVLWQADPLLAQPHPVWGEGQHTDDPGNNPRPDRLAGQSAKSAEIPTATDVGRLRTVPPEGHEPPTVRPLADAGWPADEPTPEEIDKKR
jgi:hypothetical protein